MKLLRSILLLNLFLLFYQNTVFSQNYFEKCLLQKDSIAPNFDLITTSGDSVHLSDYKGKIVVLDFWYVGCKPCVKAYNDIKAIENELGKNNFVILGMNPITRKNKIIRYIKKGKYADKTIICSKSIKNQYRIKAYPTIYVINKQGKIAIATAGYYSDLKSKIKKVIIDESKNKKGSMRKFL